MSFEWQTEESEDVWKEQPETVVVANPKKRRRWWILLAIVVITAGIGYTVYAQLEARAVERENQIRSDVRSSYELIAKSDNERDMELYRSMLSGNNEVWSYGQVELFAEDMLFERPFPGWQLDRDFESPGVDLTANFGSATLMVTRTYQLESGPPVYLEHTLIFRRGQTRWLHAHPVNDEYWGSTSTLDGQFVTITYPGRDAEMAIALQGYLNRQVLAYCRVVGDCPADLRINLELSNRPQVVPNIFRFGFPAYIALGECCQIQMQAPTLTQIGKPVDDYSRDQLFNQYALLLLSVLNHELRASQLYGESAFDHVLFSRQMQEIGIDPYFVPRSPQYLEDLTDYEGVWRQALNRLDVEQMEQSAVLFDFIETQMDEPISAHALQTSLMLRDEDRDLRFLDWLSKVTLQPPNRLQRAWLQYAYEQAAVENTFDDGRIRQSVQALCTQDGQIGRYIFDFVNRSWEINEIVSASAELQPLPQDNGYIIQSRHAAELADPSLNGYFDLVVDDQLILSQAESKGDETVYKYFGTYTPDREQLVVVPSINGGAALDPGLLDLNSCAADEPQCSVRTMQGEVYWAPSGENSLLIDIFGTVYLADSNGEPIRILEDRSSYPFWLDDETAGYFANPRISTQSFVAAVEYDVMVLQVNQAEAEIAFSTADFLPILNNAGENIDGLQLRFVTPNRQTGKLIFSLTSVSSPFITYLIEADIENSELRLINRVEGLFWPPVIDTAGRYATLTAFSSIGSNNAEPAASSFLIEIGASGNEGMKHLPVFLDNGDAPAAYQPDWSWDGRLLLVNSPHSFTILEPGTNEQRRYFHDFESCQYASWINSN